MAKEDKRDRLVEIALDLFTANGCNGVTMDDIAQAAHISKRTLYETFANKEELLAECLMLVHQSIDEQHRQAHKQVAEPMLVAMYMLREGAAVNKRYARLLSESRRYYPEIHNRFFSLHTEQLKEVLHKGFDYMREHSYLREKVDVEVAVEFLCDFIQRWCTEHTDQWQTTDRHFNEVCFTYLRGTMNTNAIARYESNENEFQRLLNELCNSSSNATIDKESTKTKQTHIKEA